MNRERRSPTRRVGDWSMESRAGSETGAPLRGTRRTPVRGNLSLSDRARPPPARHRPRKRGIARGVVLVLSHSSFHPESSGSSEIADFLCADQGPPDFPTGAAPCFAGLFVDPCAALKPRRKTSLGFQRTASAERADCVDGTASRMTSARTAQPGGLGWSLSSCRRMRVFPSGNGYP